MIKIIVEEDPDNKRLEDLHVFDWEIWNSEKSEFPWSFKKTEICYFLEGEVIITTEQGDIIEISKGDLVTFPGGISCNWKNLTDVKLHYKLLL